MSGGIFHYLHVTLADANFNVFGGHLSAGEIGVTGELLIEPFDKEIEGKLHQETGFRLLALEEDKLALITSQTDDQPNSMPCASGRSGEKLIVFVWRRM